MSSITICEARPSDVSSLSTIHSRAFHPVNAYQRRLFPDTPLLRQWWEGIFAQEIQDSACHVLTAIDANASDPAAQAVGVLCLRLMEPDQQGGGFWTMHPLTAEHDAKLYERTMAPMGMTRLRLMQGRRHLLLELFGVDHSCQGAGVGKRLLRRACAIADQQRQDIFVEANYMAKPFYVRFGFEPLEELQMPTEGTYTVYLLVRKSNP